MAPIVVTISPRVGARNLIMVGFGILALPLWYFASFDLSTEYRHQVGARALQGFGISFLFVPTNQLAYSFLPKAKNNKASSWTNLFRNHGGSFGIAFVTTMLERRTQFHQNVLVQHVSAHDSSVRNLLNQSAQTFIARGASYSSASPKALGLLSRVLIEQASMLAFLDCFRLLGAIALLAVPPPAVMIKKFTVDGSAQGQ
jgi:DHA2 family multidrug resistance protein